MLLILILAGLNGCVTAEPPLPIDADLATALSAVGTHAARPQDGSEALHVVVIRDRHSVGGGLRRVREQIRNVHRENRLVVEYLVGNGYALLGCEYPLGELEPNRDTDEQYVLVRKRLAIDDPADMDVWSLYQPIRYQLAWEGKLEVFGVEDPDLYREDVAELQVWLRSLRAAKRNDFADADREAALRRLKVAERNLARFIVERGRAAGHNLVELMRGRGHTRAILQLGGAHVPSAVTALEEEGVAVDVFQPASYDAAPTDRGRGRPRSR